MMLSQSIQVAAPPKAVYAVVRDVASWARLLPHYRYVRVLERSGDDCVCIMAARRNWIPVRWVAAVHLQPEIPSIQFTHVGGPTTGMKVEWIFDARPGGTLVTIRHEMSCVRGLLVRTPLGTRIAAKVFIEPIASRTLACMKAIVEGRNA
jgi:ribosome-associated toxin RatA of RatAB toxin-antitoxin module